MENLRFAILTVSDRSAAGLREDLSGPALVKRVSEAGWNVVHTAIIPDEYDQIRDVLLDLCDRKTADVILTTGGTGFAPRDITPEATKSVLERETPGLVEGMRATSLQITPHAMLSRAAAGIRGSVVIINLPGSPKAAVENFNFIQPVLKHAVELLRSDPAAEGGHAAKPASGTFSNE